MRAHDLHGPTSIPLECTSIDYIWPMRDPFTRALEKESAIGCCGLLRSVLGLKSTDVSLRLLDRLLVYVTKHGANCA